MLRLASSWVWDYWLADDGERFHLFYLQASRALHDEHRRHLRASVGHAVSTDLREWEVVADALVPDDPTAYDDQATWTGSVVRDPSGGWRMFYTGVDRASDSLVQRIVAATSEDLHTWHKVDGFVLEADPRWYDVLDVAEWPDQAWRDPWVYADPSGDGWHMLITARAGTGDPLQRGVVGHATSPDLREWTITPPLSVEGGGFGQLEVLQVEEVEGRPVVLFSCLGGEMAASRRSGGNGGVWAVDADSPTGPFDISSAYLLLDDRFYVGRLVRDRAGEWQLLAFHNRGPDGFVGEIADPMPVRRGVDGRLTVTGGINDEEL